MAWSVLNREAFRHDREAFKSNTGRNSRAVRKRGEKTGRNSGRIAIPFCFCEFLPVLKYNVGFPRREAGNAACETEICARNAAKYRSVTMYKALSPYAIGVKVQNVQEAVAAAKIGGFTGVEFSPAEVADLIERDGIEAVKAIFSHAGIRPAGFGLPTDWRSDETAWQEGLKALPRLAKAAAAIGGTRTMTWIMPCSDTRDYDANRRFHIERFTPIAEILGEHGCTLGLEFIGPKTLRDSQKFLFIYRMEEMLAMGAEIGPNVGLLLDCWHWYNVGGTAEEIRALKPEQIVYVHVNDAPSGVARDAQVDNVRGLPGETGVIDIAGFLQALQHIGYDGPVTPEPFKKALGDLSSDGERLSVVGAAMNRIFTHLDAAPSA